MVTAMSTATQRLTYEEWLNLPETKQRYEIIDGVMIVPPGPNVDHQWILLEMYSRLSNFARTVGIGIVLAAPLDVMIQRRPLRVRQPDVLFLNTQRTGIRRRADVIGMNFLELPPDLVVEVLSPSNNRREMANRMQDYQQIGVYECWLVSPEAETIEIISLTAAEPESTAIFGVEDTLRSDLLSGFELNLTEVFK
jgi:Uma2 family endonuclease